MNDKIQKKELEALYHRISLRYNIPKQDIKNIIESPYLFTSKKLEEIDIPSIETEEEAELTKTNFIYKYLGKLHTNFKLIQQRRKQSEAFKKINKKKWEK